MTPRRKLVVGFTVLALVVALSGCDIKARRSASGSLQSVYVTGLANNVTVELLAAQDSTSALMTTTSDAHGAAVFRGVPTASGYWVRSASSPGYTTPKQVSGVYDESYRPSAGDYDDWTVGRLRERAAQIGIRGRSTMNKGELVDALRTH